ncbi:MAG: inorganic phosphate transporter [Actinobacteria bacterium]|nr:MAG: inorganic phosphate transporter [Actinomycetota bacterium]
MDADRTAFAGVGTRDVASRGVTALLIVLAIGFAWSIGAHYTGAVMGMPHALRAIGAWQALLLMAPLAFLGATCASHAVEQRVGSGLTDRRLSVSQEVVVVGVAFALTTAFNRLRAPTSTIQILVFAVVGVTLAAGRGVRWSTIGHLAIVWVSAPVAAFLLGAFLTKGLDRIALGERTGAALVAVGAVAAFAMGANDVSNASGALVGTGVFGPLAAGAVGGAGIALGVLTWGKPLLRRVAFELVDVDRPMATAAQLVQAAVVLAAVAFGFFTSMNQALVGAMAGAGIARGREVVHLETLLSIPIAWVLGPAGALAAGYVFGLLVR